MVELSQIDYAGMHWVVRTEYLEALLHEVFPCYCTFPDLEGCQVFKTTFGRRTIFRLDPRSRQLPPLFIKTYTRPRPSQQIKYLFRNSRTRQEWEMGLYFEEHRLPAPACLAIGERRVLGLLQGDTIIQEYLPGHQPFQRYLSRLKDAGPEKTVRRHRAVEKFAEHVRTLHDAGIVQRDFKPENILVREQCGELQFRFIDLERALIRRGPLNLDQRIRNLAKLAQTFESIATRIDLVRFFEAYFISSHMDKPARRRVWQEVAGLSEIIARKRAAEVRVWPEAVNQLYTQFQHGRWKVYSLRVLPKKVIEKWLDQEARISEPFTALIQPDNKEITLRPRICRPGLTHGSALHALRNVHSLENRGFPWVPTMAAAQRIFAGDQRTGYLLVREDKGRFMSLKQAWSLLPQDDKRPFLLSLGAFVRRLIDRGVRVKSSFGNVIVRDVTKTIVNGFALDHLEFIKFTGSTRRPADTKPIDDLTRALTLSEDEKDILDHGFAPYDK